MTLRLMQSVMLYCYAECHYAESLYAERHLCWVLYMVNMLSVVILSVVVECFYVECCYVKCRYAWVSFMLSQHKYHAILSCWMFLCWLVYKRHSMVTSSIMIKTWHSAWNWVSCLIDMQNVIMLSLVMPNVIMLSLVMISASCLF
jgi:hypothetical protein